MMMVKDPRIMNLAICHNEHLLSTGKELLRVELCKSPGITGCHDDGQRSGDNELGQMSQ